MAGRSTMLSNNIFLVGWNGFIGNSFLNYLIKNNFSNNIYLYAREKDKFIKSNFGRNVFLCEHNEFVDEIIKDKSPVVFYLANSLSPLESQSKALESVTKNIIPFITLLEDIKKFSKKISFILSSSGGSIYGDTNGEACGIEHSLAPKSIYAANKVAQETYLNVYHNNYGLNYHILRIANPYGPGQFLKGGQGLIPALLNAVRNNEKFTVYGDGTASRDYIFIEDLNDCFLKVAGYNHSSEIFNVGSGFTYSIIDIITCLRDNGLEVDVRYVPSNSSVVNSIKLDISKTIKKLGWKPKVSLDNGIKEYIRWYDLNHP